MLYYKKVDKHDEISKTESKYNAAVETFMHAADEYISALDKGYSDWFERIRVAQITFYQRSAEFVVAEWSK